MTKAIKWHKRKSPIKLRWVFLGLFAACYLSLTYNIWQDYKVVNQESLYNTAIRERQHDNCLQKEIALFLEETMDYDYNPMYQAPERKPVL